MRTLGRRTLHLSGFPSLVRNGKLLALDHHKARTPLAHRVVTGRSHD